MIFFIELIHLFHAALSDTAKVRYYPVSLWAARPRSGSGVQTIITMRPANFAP